MSLRFTNSLTSRTEAFEPLTAGKASIYCCGVTVYDLCHLGHARSYINWDVLRRYLIWRGYDVTYVQNYTDIDDKILNRANEEGITMQAVSERNIEAFEVDMGRLGILPADRMPRATGCIEGIQTLISELESKGAAYSSDGDVYFDISKAKNYGKLSGRDPNDQQHKPAVEPLMERKAASVIPLISPCGRGPKPENPAGNPPGGQAARAGTSNAQRWCARNWGKPLTFTSVAEIWCSRTTKTRLLNRKPPTAQPWPMDAQRHGQCRWHQDVQIARQLHHHPRLAGQWNLADDPAPVCAAGALPQTA